MKEKICPMCGCGIPVASKGYGLECPKCGEVFEYHEEGYLEIVDDAKWRNFNDKAPQRITAQ